MAPPDETLVAVVATIVSLAIVLPFLIKWWPRSRPANRERVPQRRPRAPIPESRATAARPRSATHPPRARGRV